MQFGIYIERFEYFENRGDCQILSVFYTGNLRFFDSDQVAQIFLGQVAFFPNFPNRVSDQNQFDGKIVRFSLCSTFNADLSVDNLIMCIYPFLCHSYACSTKIWFPYM